MKMDPGKYYVLRCQGLYWISGQGFITSDDGKATIVSANDPKLDLPTGPGVIPIEITDEQFEATFMRVWKQRLESKIPFN